MALSANIKIYKLDIDKIDLIRSLWEGLRNHHRDHTSYFAERYRKSTFEKRKKALLAKTKHGKLNIDVAEDTNQNLLVGYCVSSVVNETEGIIGEIDSIYINNGYRKLGIGNKLMKAALNWLESEKAVEKRIVVAQGNESVFDFYRKYGFYQLHHILQQK
jgi:ribosomal protein S18 acetylase RimI-like enzyme